MYCTQVASLETRDKFVMSVSFSPNSKLVVTGGVDGLINIFDVDKQKLVQKLEGHAMPIRTLKFSADGKLLFTASDDMRINVYDV
jgi:WD repeat-containing protein 61